MLRRIGAEEGGEFKAIASGTLPSGKPVIVNADGTVSVVSETVNTETVGTAVVYEAAGVTDQGVAYDANAQKIVISYKDQGNSNVGTAIVGTVSGNSISFGTPVVFDSSITSFTAVTYDANAQKIVIAYKDGGNSFHGTAIVGTVSGTSISFGSATVFQASEVDYISAVFDSSNNKVVISYRDDGDSYKGKSIVGTISGTSISFGSAAVFETGTTLYQQSAFDSSNNKVVIAYRDAGNNEYGTAIVGTVSGTSISFGTAAVFESASTRHTSVAYDSNAGKIVIAYEDDANSDYGTAIVGTVSGTSISFGTAVVFESAQTNVISIVYHAAAKKVVIAYIDQGNSSHGTFIVGTVSGTSISFTTAVVFEAAEVSGPIAAYDSNNEKVVVVYRDNGNSGHGTSVVFNPAYTSQNLTSENYIGMSRGVNFQTGSSASLGSATTFESATVSSIASGYDTSNDKVVIFYRDQGNSDYGTAVVGTVSGSSISFGTPVVFNSALSQAMSTAFDSSNNKMPVFFRDSNGYGKYKVGTVSGTSISFGSLDVFSALSTYNISATFDTSVNKFLLVYRRAGNFSYGGARVGTVSGTDMTFGTEVNFNEAQSHRVRSTFDSSNNKHVVVYYDGGNSDHGTAIVGTISGTNVSFGSEVVFNAATTNQTNCVFDSSNNKVVVTYYDGGNSNYGTAIVGTVSGTSISFGSEVVFHAATTAGTNPIFDSNANRIALFYSDEADSYKGKVVTGTVSGTSISFSSELTVIDDSGGSYMNAVFDPDTNQSVVSFRNSTSSVGQSRLYTSDTVATTQGQVTNGQAASVDVIGSVSDNQIGLTAGQQYFVQNDGTISTTADDPSVLAGTAISATELVVKT